MTDELGLRERKKQRTREHIAETARRLFAERGFDAVTITEIAREAEVAPATVFNYFPAKEDLFYSRLEAFEDRLLTAIRERAAGVSILNAFAGFLLDRDGVLAMDGRDATEQVRTISRVIGQSPALLARERQVFDDYAGSLAAFIADDTGTPAVAAKAVANALIGLHRALIGYVREQALAGASAARIRRGVQVEGRRAIAQLEAGLSGFGTRGG